MITSRAPDRSWKHSAFFSLLLLCTLLVGCGGGGGGGSSDPRYSIGGTISGLDGTVVLQNNGGNNLSRSANDAFTFSTSLTSGSNYAVTVLTQPTGQTCAVASGTGTVGGANVTNVSVTCTDNPPDVTNANLSSLALSSGTIDQLFQASQLEYTSTQLFPVTTIQVTPVTEEVGATITVNGAAVTSGQASAPIALAAGDETVITIVVTAANGTTTRTYTIAVTRQSGSGFAQQAYIKASNTGGSPGPGLTGDQFGYGVALSGDGNTLAVGAVFESSNATGIGLNQTNNLASESGAVYVFFRATGEGWTQQAYVKASNTGAGDGFGETVALSDDGNTLAVGAPREDSNATGVNSAQGDDSATNAGAVYVFTRTGTAWLQQAYVKASNTRTGTVVDFFGASIALSGDGNTLAVGAPNEDSNATGVGGDETNTLADASGAVYVYARTVDGWDQQAYVKASNTDVNDGFGESVALSTDGNTLAVGAAREDSNAVGVNNNQTNNLVLGSGAVYVFTRGGGAVWSQQAYVKASNTGADDAFGFRVALSGDGNTLAVGAEREDSNATTVNGDQANNSATDAGAVYVFTRSGSVWTQQAYVKAANAEANDRFGWRGVALSSDGNVLAVGADGEDGDGIGGNQANNSASASGAVYVFTRTGTSWSQRQYVKASNAEANDRFGFSIALSSDGVTLAVGADGEDSNATGVGGDETNNAFTSSGAAYIFVDTSAD